MVEHPLKLKKVVKRYAQLDGLIAQIKPRTIVEVGTHRAKRAAQMSIEAFKHAARVHYMGFDIFEGGDAAFQHEVLNDKGMPEKRRAIKIMRKLEKLRPDGFSWELVEGDTRETLAGKDIVADFVFIDGDHRLATIRSDYEAVRGSRCVVFDDYFLPSEIGELPDLDRYGANRVIDEIEGAMILPITDKGARGWRSALAVVMRG